MNKINCDILKKNERIPKMYYADLIYENGSKNRITAETRKTDYGFSAKIPRDTLEKGIDYVNFMPDFGSAEEGSGGYMVAPRGGPYVNSTYMLCKFNEHKDGEQIVEDSAIALFGVKKNDLCFAAIVDGMRLDYDTVLGKKDGKYYIYPRFKLDGELPCEDISVQYHILDLSSEYSDMARAYRNYRLARGECVPLRERIKNNPCLEYAANAMNVRIRLGMKPLPTPVMEQTPETEPPMCVCCTFGRMKDLIDEFKRQGIDRAEFCLIGWNRKGHDGRYPSMFPVEPSLGGEEALRDLIKYGQENGYQMTCHSNSSDAYSVSEMWNRDDILRLKNGDISVDPNPWSGGRMYQLCPEIAEKQAEALLPKIADLGFYGVHYIDVLSLHPPRKCYSEKHPLTKAKSAECNKRIMRLTKKLMGGFSSEGGYDTNIGELDFALVVHPMPEQITTEFCDRVIPLWELVYHGIVLHNTSWQTSVYVCGEKNNGYYRSMLKNIEFGGRPVAYFHMGFRGHPEDLYNGLNTADNTSMAKSVEKIRHMYDYYKELSRLQFEFMENHRELSDGVFESEYSDGTTVTVDYNNLDYRVEKQG